MLFQILFEEGQNTAVFIRPTFGPDKAVILRRIKLFAEILGLAQTDQLFCQLHRILNMHIVINDAVQYSPGLSVSKVCLLHLFALALLLVAVYVSAR